MQTVNDFFNESEREGVEIVEHAFKTNRLKGLYTDGTITINKSARLSEVELKCVIAEELGHHHTSSGIILDQSDAINRKQERRAKDWAINRLITLSDFVNASIAGIRNQYEMAHFLGVTEEFLLRSVDYLQRKHGPVAYHDDFMIQFSPLLVFEPYFD